MLYLKDKKLTPILGFMSKKKTYSDILSDLYEGLDIDLQLVTDESPEVSKNIVFSSNYFVQPNALKEWCRRLSKGKLNVSIYDGSDLILHYHCSKFAENKAYDVSGLPDIEIIDYSFVKDYYRQFRSRSKNIVDVLDNVIIKQSSDVIKIQSEFKFISALNNKLDFYIPVFDLQVSEQEASYKMPLVVPGDISSYFLNNDTAFFLESRFESFCVEYFSSSVSGLGNNSNHQSLEHQSGQLDLKDKLCSRMLKRQKEVEAFLRSHGASSSSLRTNIYELQSSLSSSFEELFQDGHLDFVANSPVGEFHGDFCLSNILYDDQSKRFFLIDPRGDELSPMCLDLAKLSHSLHGHYDSILADKYYISMTSDGLTLNVDENPFFSSLFNKILEALGTHSIVQIRLLESYFFLTMIIFHKDDLERCLAFLLKSRDILLSLPLAKYLELSYEID